MADACVQLLLDTQLMSIIIINEYNIVRYRDATAHVNGTVNSSAFNEQCCRRGSVSGEGRGPAPSTHLVATEIARKRRRDLCVINTGD